MNVDISNILRKISFFYKFYLFALPDVKKEMKTPLDMDKLW